MARGRAARRRLSRFWRTRFQLRACLGPGTAPRALATFRNLTLNTYRLAGRANIAHARRALHDRADAFAVYDI